MLLHVLNSTEHLSPGSLLGFLAPYQRRAPSAAPAGRSSIFPVGCSPPAVNTRPTSPLRVSLTSYMFTFVREPIQFSGKDRITHIAFLQYKRAHS